MPSPAHRPSRLVRATIVLVACAVAMCGLVADVAGAAPKPVVDTGPRIAYLAVVNGIGQVFTMRSDGSDKRQITSNATGTKKCDPVLSPSANEVAYAANDGGIYVHPIGGAEVNVAPPVDKDAEGKDLGRGGGRRPVWADANTLVFGYSTNYNADLTPAAERRMDLWMTQRIDGVWGDAHPITDVGPGASAIYPGYNSVRPGFWMSFTYLPYPGATPELRLMQAQPGMVLGEPVPGQALPSAAGAYMSTWNASGTKIAFVTGCASGVQYVNVSSDGTSWSAGQPVSVLQSGGCGVSFSRSDPDRLAYADSSRVYVKNVTSSARATSLGVGAQPGW